MHGDDRRVLGGICLVVALAFGFGAGHYVAGTQLRILRASAMSGPLSDDFDPALNALAAARKKAAAGDNNIADELDLAERHIESAKRWMQHFAGGDGAKRGENESEK
jgi:hypothetical protein